jgi:hypothetical protein
VAVGNWALAVGECSVIVFAEVRSAAVSVGGIGMRADAASVSSDQLKPLQQQGCCGTAQAKSEVCLAAAGIHAVQQCASQQVSQLKNGCKPDTEESIFGQSRSSSQLGCYSSIYAVEQRKMQLLCTSSTHLHSVSCSKMARTWPFLSGATPCCLFLNRDSCTCTGCL